MMMRNWRNWLATVVVCMFLLQGADSCDVPLSGDMGFSSAEADDAAQKQIDYNVCMQARNGNCGERP